MAKQQFRVLYREFLFRMVDLEVLSSHAQGDISKLLGQFAALLLLLSMGFCLPALGYGSKALPPVGKLMYALSTEHFLIATTMLVVGLFAVLSWDSTFPNRRDVLVLAPLPVRATTLFLAKVAAVASALSLTVLTLHVACGFVWPLTLNIENPAMTVPSLTYDTAIAAVDADRLQAVLNHDLAQAYKPGTGPLAPGYGTGVAIGVSTHGVRRVFAYGAARTGSMFEIGSISKTFTGLILAKMVVEGKVSLNQPLRELLPEDLVKKPGRREITLLDLATHRSGLPSMPDNLPDPTQANPYANYHTTDMYEYMERRGVYKLPDEEFNYSNLGYSLLGQVLASRAGRTYPDLLRDDVTGPLHLDDTVITLSGEQQRRFIEGHFPLGHPVHAWDMDALAPAGGIRSTAGDMLTYLEANLNPTGGLSAALIASHQLKAEMAPGHRIAIAWIYDTASETYWHNGATRGYTSYAFFRPKDDSAAIVLVNNGPWPPFCGLVGEHIRQRLTGKPAVSLNLLVIPASGGIVGLIRLYVVYWFTMLSAGVFIFCCVLGLQGLAAQVLPRRVFLRASSFLQLAAFCLFVSVYFLQPLVATPEALMAAQGNGPLAWSPSFWFLGLFQKLSGSPALGSLAARAWIGLAIAVCGTAVAYLLSYLRTLRKIVEEPDIVRGSGSANWLPRFGNSLETAIVQFSLRSLLRSRQHRVIFAFYVGIGFALSILFLKTPQAQQQMGDTTGTEPWQLVSVPMLASSIVMLGFWIIGMRVVFSMPLDLRANWVFRVTPVRGALDSLKARRRALLILGLGPPLVLSAALLMSVWPPRMAVKHVIVLSLLGLILAELSLHGAQKLPFTCSYLPGKSNFHLTFWLCIGLIVQIIDGGAQLELRALYDSRGYVAMQGILGAVAILARWRTGWHAKSEEIDVQFEDAPVPAILALQIHKDGVVPL